MTSNSELATIVKEDIDNAIDFFTENELVIGTNSTVQVQVGRDSYLVCWRSRPSLSYLFKSPENFGGTTPIGRFREALDRRDYNVLLSDGSIVQLAYIVKNEEVVWHRLCFLPCPLAFNEDDLADFSISEMFDVFKTEELLTRAKMVTPIRFDYNINLSDKVHPTSHMTIGKNSCRIPVFGPLSVGHFLAFVTEHFYSDDIDFTIADPPINPVFWKRTFLPSSDNQLFLETTQ